MFDDQPSLIKYFLVLVLVPLFVTVAGGLIVERFQTGSRTVDDSSQVKSRESPGQEKAIATSDSILPIGE